MASTLLVQALVTLVPAAHVSLEPMYAVKNITNVTYGQGLRGNGTAFTPMDLTLNIYYPCSFPLFSSEAVLARDMMGVHACCDGSMHAPSITPLWVRSVLPMAKL
jgi:hypothetical protein